MESERQFSRKYRLKGLGYDFERVIERVSELFHLEKEYITAKGRQQDRVMSRDFICYWAAVEVGMSVVDVAKKFNLTPAAISYAVQRGEKMAKEKDFDWLN